MAEQWLSITEYARERSLSDMTVRRRIKNGKLQAILRDGKYYIAADNKTVSSQFDSMPNSNIQQPHMHRPQVSNSPTVRKPLVPQQYGRSEPIMEMQQSYESSVPTVKPKVIPGPQTIEYIKNKSSNESNSLETTKVFSYFESMLERLDKNEIYLKNQYQARIHELEAKLENRDIQMRQLKQQLEDLQLLVNIIDKQKKS